MCPNRAFKRPIWYEGVTPFIVSWGSIPPPAKIFRQITAAPTKEMAKGTKIKVFAITPHRTESAKTAINNPKIMHSEGTKISHIKLFRMANLN